MNEPHKLGDIEIDEDMPFLRKEWRLQRVAWIFIALIVLAGLLGAFGRGPLSKASIGDPNQFVIEYDRIIRHGATDNIDIDLGPTARSDTTVELKISRAYIEKNEVQFIAPEPAEQGAEGEFHIYTFARRDPTKPMHIVIQLRPEGYGSSNADIQVMGRSSYRIKQFILP